MYTKGRGRGLLGSYPESDFPPGIQNHRIVQPVVLPTSHRIVSLASPPPRPPISSRLGWTDESMGPHGASGSCSGPLKEQSSASDFIKPRPKVTPGSFTLDSKKPQNKGKGKYLKQKSPLKVSQNLNVLVKSQQIVTTDGTNDQQPYFTIDKDDFTNDVMVDGFSNSPNPAKEGANLDSYVLNLLHSIEDGHVKNVSKREDLEEGECEEPQDFPSRMAQYHSELVAIAALSIPINPATVNSIANSNNTKPSCPENSETTRNLKQALEDIRRREQNQASQSFTLTEDKRVDEKKVIKLTSSKNEASKDKRQRTSVNNSTSKSQEHTVESKESSETKSSVNKERSSQQPVKEDSEWRREVRIVDRSERAKDRGSHEREVRRVRRSDSRNRSRSPWWRQVRRNSPIRRRSRSRSPIRRRSRTRSPSHRRRSRTRSPSYRRRSRTRSPSYRRRSRSRSPSNRRKRSRSPTPYFVKRCRSRSIVRRDSRSPGRRSGSPMRRDSRDRSTFDCRTLLERKAIVARSRSGSFSSTHSRNDRSRTPTRKIREELLAIQNGSVSTQNSAPSQHCVPTTSLVSTAPSEVAVTPHANIMPSGVPTGYNIPLPISQQPLSHQVIPTHLYNHGEYYAPAVAAATAQEQYVLQQFQQHQLMQHQSIGHQQHHAHLLLHHQMLQRQQLEEQIQQHLRQYQPQQPQETLNCSPTPPSGITAGNDKNLPTKAPTSIDQEYSYAIATHKDEVAALEQRLRTQRDSKLEKQLNLIHQLLILRFQQADFEQKQKAAVTEVDRERLSLSIMEKAKLEKAMAGSAQSLEKFIERATTQLKEDLTHIKKERSNHLYRFYDPQQHWCELCDVFCEKLSDYLSHLHSKEHETRLESTGVPSMPWHNKKKEEKEDKLLGKEGLIANRIPFGGLQCLQPVKAWYCELCDTWMGDNHCAQIHMTSTQHNDLYLKRLMERPDPCFFHAVKKQTALKKYFTRLKEEEIERKKLNQESKRKMGETMEARKKKKMEVLEKKKKIIDDKQKIIREENNDGSLELDETEPRMKVTTANACDPIQLNLRTHNATSIVGNTVDTSRITTPINPVAKEIRIEVASVTSDVSNDADEVRNEMLQDVSQVKAKEAVEEVSSVEAGDNTNCTSTNALLSEDSRPCKRSEVQPTDGVDLGVDSNLNANIEEENNSAATTDGKPSKEASNNDEIFVQQSIDEQKMLVETCTDPNLLADSTLCSEQADEEMRTNTPRGVDQCSPLVLQSISDDSHVKANGEGKLLQNEEEKSTSEGTRCESVTGTSSAEPNANQQITSISEEQVVDSGNIVSTRNCSLMGDVFKSRKTFVTSAGSPISNFTTVPIKQEPAEHVHIKTEPHLCPTSRMPEALVKSEPPPNDNLLESNAQVEFHLGQSNLFIKKESEIKTESVSLESNSVTANSSSTMPLDCESSNSHGALSVLPESIEKLFDSGSVTDDDCYIVNEIDTLNTRIVELVDLEPAPRSSTRNSDVTFSASTIFDSPDDAQDSEVSVQLSDYIVLSETGPLDPTETDQ